MSMMQIVYTLLIFIAVTLLAMLVLTRFAPSPVKKRLSEAIYEAPYRQGGDAGWVEQLVELAGPLAKLSLPKEGWEKSPLRARFMHAGYRKPEDIAVYFAAKTVLAVLLPTLAFVYASLADIHIDADYTLLPLLCLAAAGYYLPNVLLARMVARRQRGIFESFPDAADLMLVCVESGLALDGALAKVAEEIRLSSPSLADELHLVNLEMRAGGTRETALRNLVMRTGVREVEVFVTLLVQADRFGTSIGDALRVYSDELRTKRALRAEELAVKTPLKLLFPLVFCIFPSLLVVLLGSAFIQIYRILLPTMTGGG